MMNLSNTRRKPFKSVARVSECHTKYGVNSCNKYYGGFNEILNIATIDMSLANSNDVMVQLLIQYDIKA